MRYNLLTWEGQELTKDEAGHFVWVEVPSPMGGERVSMGTLGMVHGTNSDTATHYEVPVTVWGDYCGDSCGRSNYRSLLRDYPETFVEVWGDYGSHYLAIPIASMTEELDEIFAGLAEQYPLYDEEDHSMLEMDEAMEQWESWARDDILHSLRRDHGLDTDDIDLEVLAERFWSFTSERSEYPYLEDAVSIVYPGMDDFVTMIAEEMASET